MKKLLSVYGAATVALAATHASAVPSYILPDRPTSHTMTTPGHTVVSADESGYAVKCDVVSAQEIGDNDMNKILSVCSVASLAFGASNAIAAPSYVQPDARNTYYDYAPSYSAPRGYGARPDSVWYIGGRAGLSLLNFDTDMTMSLSTEPNFTEKYSFEPVFSGAMSVGFGFNYFWRAELELGYIGEFNDADNVAEFKLSAPYAIANVYYDFAGGAYAGAGVGASLLTTTWDGIRFPNSESRHETSFAPMFGVMLGYAHDLGNNMFLDFRYRLAGIIGHEHAIKYEDETAPGSGVWATGDLKSDTGLILDNSFSLGIRFEF